jgi:hypothetical protein
MCERPQKNEPDPQNGNAYDIPVAAVKLLHAPNASLALFHFLYRILLRPFSSKKPEPRQKLIFLTGFGLMGVILYEIILRIKKIL